MDYNNSDLNIIELALLTGLERAILNPGHNLVMNVENIENRIFKVSEHRKEINNPNKKISKVPKIDLSRYRTNKSK